jgi:hypothetical protein
VHGPRQQQAHELLVRPFDGGLGWWRWPTQTKT